MYFSDGAAYLVFHVFSRTLKHGGFGKASAWTYRRSNLTTRILLASGVVLQTVIYKGFYVHSCSELWGPVVDAVRTRIKGCNLRTQPLPPPPIKDRKLSI